MTIDPITRLLETWKARMARYRQDAHGEDQCVHDLLEANADAIEECHGDLMAVQLALAALVQAQRPVDHDAQRCPFALQWAAASLFIRDVAKALGHQPPVSLTAVDIEQLATAVVGQIEELTVSIEVTFPSECICDGGPQGEGLSSIPHYPHCPLAKEHNDGG